MTTLNRIGLSALFFAVGLFWGWRVSSTDSSLYEFYASPTKTSTPTSGFGCYCTTSGGNRAWRGKVYQGTACPPAAGNRPSFPKKLANLNITSGACCRNEVKVNGVKLFPTATQDPCL